MARVLLVLPSTTYRAPEFLAAAGRLGVDVVTASDAEQAFSALLEDRFVRIDLDDAEHAACQLVEFAKRISLDAIVAVDDRGLIAAARAAEMLGLSTNPVEAVTATRDKVLMRDQLSAMGVAQPDYRVVDLLRPDYADHARQVAEEVGYPVVLKPATLSGSRGVIRVDASDRVAPSARRIAALCAQSRESPRELLVEAFVSGTEVALEGLLTDGSLEVLALFDKPDPLDGPYFEETLYVTPSRLCSSTQHKVAEVVEAACRALGLRQGPIHAEARIGQDQQVTIIEAAARTIGGKCSKALRFSSGSTLEELVLRQALGERVDPSPLEDASGVMMLPIASSGRLSAVEGRERVLAIPGITALEISIPIGHSVQALPEGDRYLGFLFARAKTADQVELALRRGHEELEITIEPLASPDGGIR